MEKVAIGGVAIDRCPACGAMWFDLKELQQVISSKGAAAAVDSPPASAAPEILPGPILCPRDQTRLIGISDRKQKHVEIMSCQSCGGVLLDAGELKDLSEFTLAERVKALFS